MTTLSFRSKCPSCGQTSFHRIQRNWWMRFLPGSKLYHCIFCYTKFVSFRSVVDEQAMEQPDNQHLNATNSGTSLG